MQGSTIDAEFTNFDIWQNMLTAVCGYFTSEPPITQPFSGQLELGRFGNMDIAAISGNVKRINKTKQDVSRSDDANLFLILGVKGDAILEQSGNSAHLGVGDICLIDSRRPSEFTYKDGFKQISIHLPEMQTREVFNQSEIPLAQTLGYEHNQSLRAHILHMYQHAHLSNAGATLENAKYAHNNDCLQLLWRTIFSDNESALSQDIIHMANYRRVNQYIEDNLKNAELDLEGIATACGMSRRSLHRLFERHGLSPLSWIRMRRLELARNDLMAASSKGQIAQRGTCTDIAYKYGFSTPAHFSRVFKHKFGLPPRQFQNQYKSFT